MKQLVRLTLLAVLALALAACGSSMQSTSSEGVSSQITYGELDGNRHPYVGLMVAQDKKGNPLWRCSGTLMSPTLFLTAGHCTEPPAAKVEIWFDADVESGIPGNGYPYKGQTGGKPYTHPQYDPNAFFRYDLGMVVLDRSRAVRMSQYGALPSLDVLDQLAQQRGLQNVTFTAVGYGLQRINPVFVEAARVRMLARPHLVQINTGFTGDFSILLSNNASTGGTCFGDSGGPNFIGDSNVIGGVTSFGINGNCAGTGGVYRVDRKDDLDWLATFGLFPQP
ncbi:MAG: trypsin-like serine protease [Meiothermus ruber]